MLNILNFNHLGDILNIILFMSTGALTLIGLISFFGSITLQQRINVAREIINDIENLVGEKLSDQYVDKVITLFSRYKRISKVELKHDKVVIDTIRWGLVVIILVWITIPIVTIPIYHLYEWIYLFGVTLAIIFVLLLFYRLIGRLIDVFGISSLPTYEELLDVNNDCSLELIELIGKSMNISITSFNDKITIEIGFPMLFNGMTVVPSIFSNSSKGGLPNIHYDGDDKAFSIDDYEGYRHLSDKYVWYKIKDEIEINNFAEYISIQFQLNSNNAAVIVLFQTLRSELNSNEFSETLCIPTSTSLLACRQSDILGYD